MLNLRLICRQRPYVGKTRKEIRDNLLSKQVQIKQQEIPAGWSLEAADFINKVIIEIRLSRYQCHVIFVLADSKEACQ